jgi:basic amino acid/polyamine antiporter, APA family
VHPRFHTPHIAILATAAMATLGIVGCHVAGDFFLGIDILVTSMLVNFLLMAVSVLTLPRRNPALARGVTVLPARGAQLPLAWAAVVMLALFLGVHTWRDVTRPVAAWYFRSTPVWLLVMAAGSVIYVRETRKLRREGVDLDARFAALPPG